MKGADRSPRRLMIGSPDEAGAGVYCDRADLARWSTRGGPIPSSLAAHVGRCRECADRVRHVNRLNASMTLLKAQAVPAGLMNRASQRALRMLRRAERTSADAQRALQAQPDLSSWQRTKLHLARGSMGAAAALLVLVMRVGVLGGLEQTRAAGEALAKAHWDKHIDPDGEWFDTDGLA